MLYDPFGVSTKHHISKRGNHITLGMKLIIDKDTKMLLFKASTPTTPSSRLPQLKTELKDAILVSIAGAPVSNIKDVKKSIKLFRDNQTVPKKVTELIFLPSLRIPTYSGNILPQLHFRQLTIIAKHHHITRHDLPPFSRNGRKQYQLQHDMPMHSTRAT